MFAKPVLTVKEEWRGSFYLAEAFPTSDISEFKKIDQVQAVCFTGEGKVILTKHIDGWRGLPGGHLHDNEDLEQALKRELLEEAAVELLDWGVIGYERCYFLDDPEKKLIFVRVWARINPLNEEVADPDKKSLGREIVSFNEALKKLDYGEKGKLWLKEAKKHLTKNLALK